MALPANYGLMIFCSWWIQCRNLIAIDCLLNLSVLLSMNNFQKYTSDIVFQGSDLSYPFGKLRPVYQWKHSAGDMV